MKRPIRTALACALALIMALSCIPVSALSALAAKSGAVEPFWTVPEGYNAHDYGKCVAFLEQTDASGVKNGAKLSSSYDPNDPNSWGIDGWGERTFQWIGENGELRLMIAHLANKNLAGALDLSDCPMLSRVICWDNRITSVNVSNCPALTDLYFSGNLVSEIDVSGNERLEILSCGSNLLTQIDVSSNPALWYFYCYDNELTELDVSNNPALLHFSFSYNPITAIDLSHNPRLTNLYCVDCELTQLDLSHNPALETVGCEENAITSLDLSNHTALGILTCWENALTELNLTGCTALNQLHCDTNELTELDVSSCYAIENIDCSNNLLTSLDLSNNPDILSLGCISNPIRSLDLSRCAGLPLDSISAQGSGYIGYFSSHDYHSGNNDLYIFASPEQGEQFQGFYDRDGALISNGAWYDQFNAYYHHYGTTPNDVSHVVARFTGSAVVPGDSDGSGSVNIADAVLAMRYAMGLIDSLPCFENADMDGNGSITIADAVAILRVAMGLA